MATHYNSSHDLQRLSIGVPVQVVVKIKPNAGYYREDIQIRNDRIGLLDVNNRIREDFGCNDIIDASIPMQQFFQDSCGAYVRAIIEGVNIAVIGFGTTGSGKSSILLKYVDNTFEDTYVCTIGVDFKIKSLEIDNKRIKLQVWDTAGQERFKPITKCYFRGSHGCIVLFDITNRSSFNNVKTWVSDYRENNTVDSSDNVVVIGNKADKENDRVVTVEEGNLLAESISGIYVESSARTGQGVPEAFETIAKVVLKNMKHEFLTAKNKEVDLASKPIENPQKKKSCCFS